MYNRSSKKQVQYSLEQLSKGLFYHLKYRRMEDISITDICKKANVSRRTFYRNCESKEDLVLYVTDHLVKSLLADVDYSERDPYRLYTNFFNYWSEHKVFLDLIYKNSLFELFLKEFMEVCNEFLRYPLQEESFRTSDSQEFSRRYSNAFIVGGLGQMLKVWVAECFSHSAEEIASSILYLVPSVY